MNYQIPNYSKADTILNTPGHFYFQFYEDTNDHKVGNSVNITKKEIEQIKNNIHLTFSEISDNLKKYNKSEYWDYYKNIVNKLERFSHSSQLRFPGLQVISLSQENVELFSKVPEKLLICEKSDGVRYLLIHFKNGKVLFLGRRLEFFIVDLVTNLPKIPTNKFDWEIINLIDGELILDKSTSTPNGKMNFVKINEVLYEVKFIVFDAIMLNQRNIGHLPFVERLRELSEFFNIINYEKFSNETKQKFLKQYETHMDPELLKHLKTISKERCHDHLKFSIDIFFKNYFTLDNIENVYNHAKTLHHENDGIIINIDNYPYYSGQSTEIYKWKPPHLNTIDFEVVPFPIRDRTLYVLNVGESNSKIIPVACLFFSEDEKEKFLAEFNELGIVVIECYYDKNFNPDEVVMYNYLLDAFKSEGESIMNSINNYNFNIKVDEAMRKKYSKGCWRFLRYRRDKTRGNFITSYRSNWKVIEENVGIKDILLKIKENSMSNINKTEYFNLSAIVWRNSFNRTTKAIFDFDDLNLKDSVEKKDKEKISTDRSPLSSESLLKKKRMIDKGLTIQEKKKELKSSSNLDSSNQVGTINKKQIKAEKKEKQKDRMISQAKEALDMALYKSNTMSMSKSSEQTKHDLLKLEEDSLNSSSSSES